MRSQFLSKNAPRNKVFVCTGTPNANGKITQLVCQAVESDNVNQDTNLIIQDRPLELTNTGQLFGTGRFPHVDGRKCDDIDRPGPKVYVRGDASTGGNGKKKNPYNTLAQAQADTSWNTLIVLYSIVPLDGGITLRPGTAIFGDDTGPSKPLLINTQATSNGGNGIVVSGGDTSIQNLEFDNIWASAIEFSNATNITIVDCDIHGYNQGEVIVPLKGQDQEIKYIPSAGIHGQCANSGNTTLCNVNIHDNHTGDGFLEVAYNSSNRRVVVNRSNFMNLVNIFPNLAFTNTSIKGISVIITSPNAVHSVYIINTNFQNFPADNVSTRGENFSKHAIFADSNNGGKTTMLVDNCTLSNIFQDTPAVGTPWIYAGTHPVVGSTPSTIANSKKSVINVTVINCDFTAPPANAGDVMVATLTCNCNGLITSVFTNNTISNVFLGFVSFSKGISQDTLTVNNNTAYCLGSFCVAVSEQDYICNVPGAMKTNLTVQNNNVKGGNVFGGLGIVPHWSSNGIGFGVSKWASMTITVKGNCFDGSGGNLGFNAGVFGLDLFGYGIATNTNGNIKFNASGNNFINFAYDVLDLLGGTGINVQYHLKGNYWGPPLIPFTNAVVLPPSTLDVAVASDSLSTAVTCFTGDKRGPCLSRDGYGPMGTPPVNSYRKNRISVNAATTIDVSALLTALAPAVASLQVIRF